MKTYMSQYLMVRLNDNQSLTGSVSGSQVLNGKSGPSGDGPPRDGRVHG